MYKCSLNLNDAFNLVRARKSNIAPNFHFMEQLHNFERELKLDLSSESPHALMERIRQEQKILRGGKTNIPTSSMDDPANLMLQQQNANNSSNNKPQQQLCRNCGLIQDNCKCRQHTDFLSPLAQIGVSPDSGIEFDRWASSTPGGE